MIMQSRLLGKVNVKLENGVWFCYGLDENNYVIGCVTCGTIRELPTLADVERIIV